jgi:RNA polymerase sigma factor (sigma-70 family)
MDVFPEDAAEVYSAHVRELTQFVTVLCAGDTSAVEDIVMDTFVACFRQRDWALVTNQRAYLYRAALNRVRSRQRSEGRRSRRQAIFFRDRGEPVEPGDGISWELQRLSQRERAVVFLIFWTDLSLDEVAAEIGVSRATVARDLARARTSLEGVLRYEH